MQIPTTIPQPERRLKILKAHTYRPSTPGQAHGTPPSPTAISQGQKLRARLGAPDAVIDWAESGNSQAHDRLLAARSDRCATATMRRAGHFYSTVLEHRRTTLDLAKIEQALILSRAREAILQNPLQLDTGTAAKIAATLLPPHCDQATLHAGIEVIQSLKDVKKLTDRINADLAFGASHRKVIGDIFAAVHPQIKARFLPDFPATARVVIDDKRGGLHIVIKMTKTDCWRFSEGLTHRWRDIIINGPIRVDFAGMNFTTLDSCISLVCTEKIDDLPTWARQIIAFGDDRVTASTVEHEARHFAFAHSPSGKRGKAHHTQFQQQTKSRHDRAEIVKAALKAQLTLAQNEILAHLENRERDNKIFPEPVVSGNFFRTLTGLASNDRYLHYFRKSEDHLGENEIEELYLEYVTDLIDAILVAQIAAGENNPDARYILEHEQTDAWPSLAHDLIPANVIYARAHRTFRSYILSDPVARLRRMNAIEKKLRLFEPLDADDITLLFMIKQRGESGAQITTAESGMIDGFYDSLDSSLTHPKLKPMRNAMRFMRNLPPV